MKFRRAGGDARIAARAAAALALDMKQTSVEVAADITESSVLDAEPRSDNLGVEGEAQAQVPAPEDTPPEDPPASQDEPAALLLAGGYFRIRELYKPGTARLRSQEPRQLFKGKQ